MDSILLIWPIWMDGLSLYVTTRRSHGSKCNSLLLTSRQSLPQVAVYFLATVLSSALARCHRNRGKRFPGLRWQHRKNAGAQGIRPCVDSFFLSVEAILKEFCNSPYRLEDLNWFGPLPYTLWSSTLHTCRKRTNSFCKSGGWTSEFATFAVAGAIDLDSRYAGPLRVIRNEEWDENNGRMEGISWKILWLHSDCSARSFVLILCSLGFSWGQSI